MTHRRRITVAALSTIACLTACSGPGGMGADSLSGTGPLGAPGTGPTNFSLGSGSRIIIFRSGGGRGGVASSDSVVIEPMTMDSVVIEPASLNCFPVTTTSADTTTTTTEIVCLRVKLTAPARGGGRGGG